MTGFKSLTDGEYTAVVDSIEDCLATVFIEQDGQDIGDAVLEATALPEKGRHADAILSVTVENDDIVRLVYDPEETETRREAAQDRFDSLSSRAPSEDE